MKYIVVFVVLLLAGRVGFSQDSLPGKYTDWHSYIDSLQHFTDSFLNTYNEEQLKTGNRIMSPAYYNAFFSRWLAYVNFAKDGYPDGNSALIAPSTSATRTRVTLAHKGGDLVYNAGTELNFSNNIGNVISKSDVTSSTSFFASASKLPKLGKKIQYDYFRAQQNNLDKIVLLKSFMAAIQKKYGSDYAADSAKYQGLLDSIQAAGGPSRAPDRMLVDYYASRLKLRAYGLNEHIADYNGGFFDDKATMEEDSLKQVFDSLEFSNDAINFFQFGWFTGSFAYTRNDYSVYNGNAAFTKRVGDVFFDSVAFNSSYNFLFDRTQKYQDFGDQRYFLDKKWIRSVFLTLNYNLSRDVNYAHMSPVTLV